MNFQRLFMVNNSVSVSIVVIAIIFFTLADDTLSIYLNSSTCVMQSCAFNVTCNKHKPFVHISKEEFIIKEVYYTNYSILLAKADVFDEDNTCPSNHNFFFFYNYSFFCIYALVEAHSLDRLLKMNYTQVLQTGFFLQWDGTNFILSPPLPLCLSFRKKQTQNEDCNRIHSSNMDYNSCSPHFDLLLSIKENK
ncbi:hypothetical protein H5410_062127 [Solanum commersonii]|uniref:Uncharacterized protein n=1 Tax=Solanum commersonii TaxID=4109 RepID=A0A9J5W9V0_SOLCO|nr:hypothetical protein H5410_062127 [Solanum commersonii]